MVDEAVRKGSSSKGGPSGDVVELRGILSPASRSPLSGCPSGVRLITHSLVDNSDPALGLLWTMLRPLVTSLVPWLLAYQRPVTGPVAPNQLRSPRSRYRLTANRSLSLPSARTRASFWQITNSRISESCSSSASVIHQNDDDELKEPRDEELS